MECGETMTPRWLKSGPLGICRSACVYGTDGDALSRTRERRSFGWSFISGREHSDSSPLSLGNAGDFPDVVALLHNPRSQSGQGIAGGPFRAIPR